MGAPGTPLLVGRVPCELAARPGLPYGSGVLSSQGRQLQVVRMQRVESPTTIAVINKEKDKGSNRVHGTFLTSRGILGGDSCFSVLQSPCLSLSSLLSHFHWHMRHQTGVLCFHTCEHDVEWSRTTEAQGALGLSRQGRNLEDKRRKTTPFPK